MNHKSFGWVIVFGCILSVALAIFGSREIQPQAAQANTAGWSLQTTQACEAVINQLDAIHQAIWNEKVNGQATQMTAMDDLVNKQSQVDTAQCPADFRAAEARFMAAQNTLAVDAHIDSAKNGEAAFRAMFDNDSNRYSQDLAASASDGLKADLAAAKTAADNFHQLTAKYGAK
jgi:hypothetical protein